MSSRETMDLDLLVKAGSYPEWRRQLERFEQRGLRPDPLGEHASRYRLGSLAVDLVATPWSGVADNRWYAQAFEERERDPVTGVNVIPPLWFLATKLEAWRDRGRRDPRASFDLEDIVTLLRGHEPIWGSIRGERAVCRFIRAELRAIAQRVDALELIQTMIEGDAASQAAAEPLLVRMRGQ